MDWSKVKKQHVDAAIKKFIEEKPEHSEPRLYYLLYEGKKLPSKFIRGLAYSIATGEEMTLQGFSGGTETVNFFKKYGYTVEKFNDAVKRKYSVNDAVWIAAALMSAEVYTNKSAVTKADMYFKQADIIKRAQTLTTDTVDSARVSWWTNADNEKSTRNYLRADSDDKKRRLSMLDEFEEKTYPEDLDMDDVLEMDNGTITMEELFYFVKEQYPSVVQGVDKMGRQYGQFHSWNIVNEKIGIKQSDKSFFNHNGSGVPFDICWFFDAENIQNGERKALIFNYEGNEYKGHVEKEFNKMGRVRIFWESKLGTVFSTYNNESAYPEFQFEKIKNGYYNITRLDKFMNITNIDYKGVLEYLENNQEVPYSNPEATGISSDKKQQLVAIKQKGQAAVAEMKKMAEQAEQFYKLDKCLPGSWLDGSNTKTRKYLWTQMKYMGDSSNPISVSIFVEKGNHEKAYFRISLEIKNDGTDKAVMDNYHRHLHLPIKDGLVYVSGSNEWGVPAVIKDSQSSIMSMLPSYKKVQICKIIEQNEDKTNDQYHQEVMTAIGEILPYYNYVLGKTKSKEEKRGWLLTWNPANWPWKEYDEWCEGTKEDETYTISWTCNSKQPRIGDDVFLMKTGDQPRGIIAHGTVVAESTEGPHYDPGKAAAGVISNHIDVEYDRIQHIDYEEILLQDDLKAKYPQQTWSPMGSGIEIKEPIFTSLKDDWRMLISKEDAFWPSLEEYNPEITKEDWISFITEVEKPEHPSPMKMLVGMLELGGQASCKQLSDVYGGTPNAYIDCTSNLGRRAKKYFGKPGCMDDGQERVFVLPFQGKRIPGESGEYYVYRIRPELKAALAEIDLSELSPYYDEDEGETTEMKTIDVSKNTILYGPPGTGKTYSTAIYAVAICDGVELDKVKAMGYAEVMARYKDLTSAGRVAFTTFHQSYGYEEFIEGIKPVVNEEEFSLGYTIEPGIFKKFCEKAEIPKQKDIQFTETVWNVRSRANDSDVEFDYEEYLYSEGVVIVEDIEDYKRQCNFLTNMEQGDLVVLGRDFHIKAVGIVTNDTPEKIDKKPFYWKRKVEWIAKGLSLTFSDIGMVGECVSNFAVAKSKIKIQNLADIISQKEDPKPHVFVIDEINRGNISKIFGELITLIEDTKRAGMDEEAYAILPYSGEPFSVPANVYILGTMNTADRSIALMDTALRRRFEFIEMMPDAQVLRDIGADKVEDLDVAAMLEKINERITFLYDREHTIGHAFFTKLAEDPSVEVLKSIFEKSVIPLLQEYFYEDYQKIQLVLGDNGKSDDTHKFINDADVKVKDIFKGNVDEIDLPEKKYTINPDAFGNIDSYKEII